MADYYRDVIRLLRENDYEFKRQGRGDHEIWWNPKTGVRVTVDRKLRSKFCKWNLERGRASESLLTLVTRGEATMYGPFVLLEELGEFKRVSGYISERSKASLFPAVVQRPFRAS